GEQRLVALVDRPEVLRPGALGRGSRDAGDFDPEAPQRVDVERPDEPCADDPGPQLRHRCEPNVLDSDRMHEIRRFLASIGLPEGDLNELPDSAKGFPDGAQYR